MLSSGSSSSRSAGSTRSLVPVVTIAIACGTALLPARSTSAQEAGPPAVARLGDTAVITAASIEARLSAMPAFQRATFGATRAAAARAFLEKIAIPEELVVAAARDARLADTPAVAFAVDRVLSGAVVRAIRAKGGAPSSVNDEEVRAYFEANRDRYDSPARYRIARILCRTRDEAKTVLAAARADPSPKAFTDLARDHSQDKATYLRGGDVGFVADDGTSNEPGLRVDPAIVRAAHAVADGDLVPEPVPEGDLFAVVWRRGTVAARKRSPADVAAQIRDAVAKARVKDEVDKLLASLRAARVRDEDDALLDDLERASAGPAIAPPAASSRP